jgi:hypothetical protein
MTTTSAIEVSITETSRNVWRVTFDGKVLGDSQGYTEARAADEAMHIVNRETDWCLARGMHSTHVWRPYR